MFLSHYGISQKRKEEKEILKIDYSYRYWCDMLFEKCIRIFNWSGLTFPQKEIEIRLMLDGYCGFLKDDKLGLMVASGGMSGVTQYFDEFTTFTWSAPTVTNSKPRTIGKDCIVINNTQLRNSLYPRIMRYASLLSHADISLKVALVNLRETNTFASNDQNTAENIRQYHEKSYRGDMDCIIDESLVDNVKNLTEKTNNTNIMDCLDLRNELLRSFFAEIGIQTNKDKKERMIESEVNSNQQMLLFNISDMLSERQKACEEINNMFGTDISVSLSKEFSLINKESEVNE